MHTMAVHTAHTGVFISFYVIAQILQFNIAEKMNNVCLYNLTCIADSMFHTVAYRISSQ